MADQIATLTAVIQAETSGFEKGLASAKKGLGGMGAAAGAAMAGVTKALDLAIDAAQALGDAFIGSAVPFDKSLTNIQAVTGQTKAQIKALGGELLDIGAHSVAGSQAVVDAFYDIAGGISNAESRMAALKAAVALSEAGNSSLAGATQALISVMNSYNGTVKDAAHFSDVLTRTVGVGVGSLENFASALGPISGLAAKVGVKFEELGASAAFLTTKGASASQAATRLQASMTAMLNPNAQMTQALRKAGFASGEAAIKQLGLVGAINALYKASGGSADKMAKMAGSVEALQAMVALAGPEFAGFAEDFAKGLDGATAAAQKVQLGSFDAQWKMFTNSLGTAAQAVGMLVLPALNALISFINSAMGTVGKFAPLITDGISKIAGVFKPLLDEVNRVTAPLQAAIGNIKGAFDKFFSSIAEEPARVIQGDSIVDKIKIPGKSLAEKITPAFEELKKTITAELAKIDLISIGTGLINAAASFGQDLAGKILKGVLDLGTRLIAQLQAQFAGVDVLKEAGKLIDSALAFGGKVIDNLLSGLTDIVTKVGDEVGKIDAIDVGAKAGKFLADALAFGGKLIKKLVDGLLGTKSGVEGEVGTQLDGVDLDAKAGTLIGKALSVGGKLIAKLGEGIASMGATFGAEIKKNLESIDILAAAQKLLTDAAANAQKLVGQFISGIGALGHDFGFKIADNLKSIDVGAAAKSLLDGAGKIATDFINGAIAGLVGLAEKLLPTILDELGKIPGKAKAAAEAAGKAMAEALAAGREAAPAAPGEAGSPVDASGKPKKQGSMQDMYGVTGVKGGQRAGGGMNVLPGLANALIAQDQAGGGELAAQMQAQLDGAVEQLQPPAGLSAKIASFFSGADVTAALTNLGTTISGALATTFGPDGVVMTALQPFADSWSQMFGGGGTIDAAAVGMQATVDQLSASIVNVSASGTPAILEFQAVSTSAAPTITGSWTPVVSVFRELLMTLEGIAGAASRASSAMGGIPGVGGGGKGYASGGYTGNGPSGQVAGAVHRREWVVPEGGALVLRGNNGGSSGGNNITVNLVANGVNNPAQLVDMINRELKNRNLAIA